MGAAYGLLVFVVLSHGLNWPVMAVALETFTPLWLTALRFLVATVVFVAIVPWTSGLTRPPRSDMPIVLSTALVRLAAVHVLTFIGLAHVPPGRSSILVYSQALWTVPMAAVVLNERPTPVRWIGLAIGIAGIVMLVEPWALDWSQSDVVVGHAILLACALLAAAFTVHVRSHPFRSSPLMLMPWECAFAAAAACALAFVVEGPLEAQWSSGAVANVVYQGAIASGLGTWALVVMSRALPAASSTIGQMGVPCVGLLSSVWVLSENVTALVVGALLLIATGVVLGALPDWRPGSVAGSTAGD
jgi:drug/metabolite transporter (DMT)-like permease